MYDVAIVGLGPAGATLARLLPENLQVIALDTKTESGQEGFHKPCGGLLSDDAQKALAEQGLTLPLDVMVDPQIFAVRTIDVGSGITRHYQRTYVNLDRQKFDIWLRDMVPSRVELHTGARCTAVERVAGGWRVHWREDGRDHSAEARYLVGADGAKSVVRRAVYPNEAMRRYLSIQQWFPDEHPEPFYACVFDKAATDCYAWGLTKNRHFIFGGAFAVTEAKRQFAALKEKLIPYGFRLENPIKTEACMVLRPTLGNRYCCGTDDAFLIGEAAGFISPSSLEGISYALNSAMALSQVLTANVTNPTRAYTRKTRPLRNKLRLRNLKSPFMYAPPLRRLVMKSGITSLEI